MASDNDFIEALSDLGRKEAGLDYFKKLKTSGIKDVAVGAGRIAKYWAGKGLEHAANNKLPIGAAALGAGVMGTAGYLLSKPGKNGKLSADQRMARAALESSQAATKRDAEDGREPKFHESISRAAAPGISNVADVLTKHPGKVGLLGASTGAAAGLRLLKALK